MAIAGGLTRLECFRKKLVLGLDPGMGIGFPIRSTTKQRARVFPRINQSGKDPRGETASGGLLAEE
jgi:hypothetical protein